MNRLANKSLLITSSILDAYAWMKDAPNSCVRGQEPLTWKEKAHADFINALNKVFTGVDPAAQRGIDFENRMTRDLYNTREFFVKKHGEVLGMVYDKCTGGTQQAVLKRTTRIDEQDYLLYGRTDIMFPDRIIDLKTSGSFKGPDKYTSRAQHLLYIAASGIEKFEYVVCIGEDKDIYQAPGVPPVKVWTVDSVIPIDASMSKDEATERLESRVRSFVDFLEKKPELLDKYINVFTR